jgi:hypothetical protein
MIPLDFKIYKKNKTQMPFLGIIWNYKFIETAVQKVTTRL